MANFVWRAVSGRFDFANDWANTTLRINPARTTPGISDTATFDTGGGTITGTGSVGSLVVSGRNSTAWSFAGQFDATSAFINGQTNLAAGGSLNTGVFTVGGSGTLVVAADGFLQASSMTLSAGSTLDVVGTGIAVVGSSAGLAGTLTVDPGATLAAHGGTIRGSVIQNGTLLNDGGLSVTGNLSGPGTLNLSAGLLTVGGSLGGVTVGFTGAHATLMVNGLQGVSTVALFQPGDTIDLVGLPSAVLTYGPDGVTVSAGGGSIVLGAASAGTAFKLYGDGHGGTDVLLDAPPPSDAFLFTNVSLGTAAAGTGEAYAGPVDYLQHQFIWASADWAAISATVPNVFLKGGTGDDALQVSGGNNVLDGGSGSNFLTGTAGLDGGHDTFFVDSRGGAETWSTLVNFHQGDTATIFGFHTGLSTMPLTALDGAAGYQGVTVHSEINGPGTGIQSSITFAGIDQASAAAHFEFTTGTLPGSIDYLMIQFR